MRINTRNIHILYLLLLIANALGCQSTQTEEPLAPGVHLIAIQGSPLADSIAWAPNPDFILVTAGEIGMGRAQVYTLEVSLKTKKILLDTMYGDFVSATWARDGIHALVVAQPGSIENGPGGLWLIDSMTEPPKFLLDTGYSAWSPVGAKVATLTTASDGSASRQILLNLVDVNTVKTTLLYQSSDMHSFYGLSWSPDGSALALALGADGPGELYRFDLNTHTLRALTTNRKITAPAWSPVGNIIAYTLWPESGNSTKIHLLDFTQNCDVELPNLQDVWSPAWSPDGNDLAFLDPDGIYSLNVSEYLHRDVYHHLCD